MWLVRWSGLRQLDADSLRTVPESAGLYLLWSQESKVGLKCCHVDQADNLRLRLTDHLFFAAGASRKGNGPVHHLMFEFAPLPSLLLRQGAVRFLRRWYRIGGVFEEGILIPVNPPVREMHSIAPTGGPVKVTIKSGITDLPDSNSNTHLRSGVPRLPGLIKGNTLTA